LDTIIDNLDVAEILREKSIIGEFPGYDQINISFDELRQIVESEDARWKAALSKIKGVYLIIDDATSKMYVGSAYGEDGIWGRWSVYVGTGDGENQKLKELLDREGLDYLSHFHYSILEIFGYGADTESIINRENHWKEVLFTRTIGYNQN
jgi:hypothetical protein